MRRPRSILNLPPINLPFRQLVNLLLRKRLLRSCFLDKRRPDLFLRGKREFAEVEGDVDTGEEGFVEGSDSVGS